MLYQLQVGLVNLVVGRFVASIGHHRLEVGQVYVQIFNRLLVVCQRLGLAQLLLGPTANAVWPILVTKWIRDIIEGIVILVGLSPGRYLLFQLLQERRALGLHCRNFDRIHVSL